MIYLASPYSHPEPAVREMRAAHAIAALRYIAAEFGGYSRVTIFSPIVYGHALIAAGYPPDWENWKAFDCEMISFSSMIVVLKLDGWEESQGVQAEIKFAKSLGKPIEYFKPE